MAKPAKRRVQTPKSKPVHQPARPGNAPKSKLDQVQAAMRSPRGATIADLMKLTGWQMHSVRGALAGALKKKRGLTIVSQKVGAERVYRIVGRS